MQNAHKFNPSMIESTAERSAFHFRMRKWERVGKRYRITAICAGKTPKTPSKWERIVCDFWKSSKCSGVMIVILSIGLLIGLLIVFVDWRNLRAVCGRSFLKRNIKLANRHKTTSKHFSFDGVLFPIQSGSL